MTAQLRVVEDSARVLPHNPEAEMSAVGSLFVASTALARLRQAGLTPGDFYHPTLSAIFAAAASAADGGKPVDMLTVAEEMRSLGTFPKLRSMGGEAYFCELMQAVVTVENLEYTADLVRDYAIRRAAIEGANQIVVAGYGSGSFPGETATELRARVEDLVRDTAPARRRALVPMKTMLAEAIKAIEYRYEHKTTITGVPTGLERFDAMTGGFQDGDLIIVAARPGLGKTSLILNAAMHAAHDCKIPTLIFSREMSRQALIERLISLDARVDSTRLRSGFLEQRDWINLQKAVARIAQSLIDIDDSSATIDEIVSRTTLWRAQHARGQKAQVIVDYLQRISSDNRRGGRDKTRNEEVGEYSRALKQLAMDSGCPVVALSQLNRGLESRSDKRPLCSDLRESGDIEADADVIAFIYRDEVYNADTDDKGVAEIIIGKQRNGPIGTARVAWLPQYTRFENLDERDGERAPRPQPQRGRRRGGDNPYANGGDE